MNNFPKPGSKSVILFCFHLTWGAGLLWSVSATGLGTSRDSVEYLFTSLSLAKGNGFISFSGDPYILWPPLYPALMALIQLAGISNPLIAALILQVITFLLLSAVFVWLFLRISPQRFSIAVLGSMLSGASISLTLLFQTVGSDYLFLALSLCMVFFCDVYIRDSQKRTVWWMALVSALAMMQRYIGVTVFLTGAWVIYKYTQSNIWGKIKRLMILCLSILPLGMWILNLPSEALARGQPSSLLGNINQLSLAIMSWIIPSQELYGHPVRIQLGMWVFWLILLVGSLLVWLFRKNRASAVRTVEEPVFLFGVIYFMVLLAIASLSSFNNALDNRFASPLLVPWIVFLLAIADILFLFFERMESDSLRKAAGKIVTLAALFAVGMSAYQSTLSIQTHHELGWGYTSRDWNEHSVIRYWEKHLPDTAYQVFSNYPAGLAVHTWNEVFSSPRRTEHPNVGEQVIPLDTYVLYLTLPGKDSYLVWIEPNEYTHVYSVDDLREVVNIETVYENENGGIYRILPK